jgi:protocatechuate 3,4-dioxygenase alpha subunit
LKADRDLLPTPEQTAGPFFHLGCTEPRSLGRIASPEAKGERVRLVCTVRDGDGHLVNDAMIEVWQANAEGKYCHEEDRQAKALDPHFHGFGRLATDETGSCVFETIKPGEVQAQDEAQDKAQNKAQNKAAAPQAPHLNISLFARGLLRRLATRAYFSGEAANERDPVLALVPVERRETLMARPDPARKGEWRFEIRLSGEGETVFFDV